MSVLNKTILKKGYKMSKLLKTKEDMQQFKIWIEALRSGKFEQTKERLQDKDGYCCLGVACEVLIPEHEKVRRVGGNNYLSGALPSAQPGAPGWLKVISFDIAKHTDKIELAEINDTDELSFDEIADILESTYIYGGYDV
jgi:hypothetical protein